MKYMVCVDGGGPSTRAFEFALQHAIPAMDQILLLNVIDAIKFAAPLTGAVPHAYEELMRQQVHVKKEKLSLLEQFAARAKERNIHSEVILAEALNAKEEICRQVEEHKVDYLVVGRTGTEALERFFFGTTSDYCVRNATSSVIVIR